MSGYERIIDISKCLKCGSCAQVCPENHLTDRIIMIFYGIGCAKCGKCVLVCPSGALSYKIKRNG